MSEPPVVLVHGFASSFEHNWRRTGWVDILSDLGRDVVGVDLLGHGTSPRPTDPAEYTRVVELVVEAMPGGAVDAVGFSAGGDTLLRIAVVEPDRFRRLALLGVGDNVFGGEGADPISSALRGDTGEEDVRGELFRRLAVSAGNDTEALTAFLARPSSPLTEADLAAVRCPVLVVLSDRDFVGPADRLLGALPNAAFVGLRGVDHFATPADFGAIDAVMRFLQGD